MSNAKFNIQNTSTYRRVGQQLAEKEKLRKWAEDNRNEAEWYSNLSAGLDFAAMIPTLFGMPYLTPIIQQLGDAGIAHYYEGPQAHGKEDYLYLADEAEKAYDQFAQYYGDMSTYQPFGEDFVDLGVDIGSAYLSQQMLGVPEGGSWYQSNPVTGFKDLAKIVGSRTGMQSLVPNQQSPSYTIL